MQRYKYFFVSTVLCLFISQFGDNASAQALYKYTDKDGKISYSDRVPKPGEKAELVTTDLETNIMAAPKNTVGGVKQTIQDVNARGKQRCTLSPLSSVFFCPRTFVHSFYKPLHIYLLVKLLTLDGEHSCRIFEAPVSFAKIMSVS